MAGRVQWEAQVDSNVAKLLGETKELRNELETISKKDIKLDIDTKSLNSIVDLFSKMEKHLKDLKSVFVDVGDGTEFSPLLKTINNIQSSIDKLSSSVKGISLNMNLDFGSDSELENKLQAKISNALQAYQRLFDHIKMSSAGGAIINTKFFDFDINQYDTMMAKLQAYKKFIENMRKEAKTQFNGKDVLYQDTDKSYWTAASAAMGQVTKAFNEIKASSDTNPLENLFGGKTDLTEVVSQLNLIVNKLGEISTTASEFKNIFANGLNVSTSVEEIEKLTSRVKELENELSKVMVSSASPVETNISSAMEQVAENAEKASKGKEKFAKANKNVKASADASTGSIEKENSALDEKVWEKNLKVIQEYMDANTKLNNLNAKDKGTGKHASDIARQEKEVEKLRESAIEARAALSSMINPHEAPIDDWGKWVEAMEKFEQATKGSAESVAKLEDALRSARNAQLSSIDSTIDNGQSKYEDFSARKAQSDAYKNSLIELGETIERLRTLRASLSNTRAFTDEEQAQIDALTQSVRDHVKEIQRMSAVEKGSDEGSRTKWANRIKEYMEKNTRLTREFREELENLIKILRTGGDSVNIKNIIGQFEDAKFRIKEAKLEGKSFFDIFKDKAVYGFAAKLANYYLSFADFIRYGRNAINTVVELNTQMINLSKVSEQSIAQISKDFSSYSTMAKDVGATISDTIEATTNWAKNGYNIPDSQELAEVALIYKNVGDIDIESANESLISTIRGFKLEAEDAMHVIDVFNNVSNNEAISAGGIGEALKRSAASFDAANTSLEQSVALITATDSVLQDEEKTGNMWRTVSARIRGAKTELEEAGLETEGMVESTSKLQGLIKGMTGFDILEEDGKTFKDIYEIVLNIGEEFQNLSDIDQAALLEALAGGVILPENMETYLMNIFNCKVNLKLYATI